MKHYAIEQWTDFIRGLVAESKRAEMEGHLKTECARCRRMVELLSAASDKDDAVQVPETVFNRARAIFPRAAPRESPLRKILAALQFDSLTSLAPAGVRSGRGAVRRLAFGVEDVTIELMVESAPKPRTVVVTGQISSSSQSGPKPGHRVRLMAKRDVLVQTDATSYGEFQLEFPRRAGLRLLIEEINRREFEVPLDLILGARRVPKSGTKIKPNPLEDS